MRRLYGLSEVGGVEIQSFVKKFLRHSGSIASLIAAIGFTNPLPLSAQTSLVSDLPLDVWTVEDFGTVDLALTLGNDFLLGVSCDGKELLVIGETSFPLDEFGRVAGGRISFNRFIVEFELRAAEELETDFLEGPSFEIVFLDFGSGEEQYLLEALAEGARARVEIEGNGRFARPMTISLRGSKAALAEACGYQ